MCFGLLWYIDSKQPNLQALAMNMFTLCVSLCYLVRMLKQPKPMVLSAILGVPNTKVLALYINFAFLIMSGHYFSRQQCEVAM